MTAQMGPGGTSASRARSRRIVSRASATRTLSRAWTSPSDLGRDRHRQAVRAGIRRVGMVAPGIAVDAARTPRDAGDPERHGVLVEERPGPVQPVDNRRIVLDALHQAHERLAGRGQGGLERAGQVNGEVGPGSARRHQAAQEAMARQALVELLYRPPSCARRPRCRSGSSPRRRCCRCRPRGCRAARARARPVRQHPGRGGHLDSGDLLRGLANPSPCATEHTRTCARPRGRHR